MNPEQREGTQMLYINPTIAREQLHKLAEGRRSRIPVRILARYLSDCPSVIAHARGKRSTAPIRAVNIVRHLPNGCLAFPPPRT
jgi:hypothetical protein